MWSQQLKAARSLIGMEQAELAERSGVSVATIKRFEAMSGPIDARTSTLSKLRTALEASGVAFVDQNGMGPGVRLRDKVEGAS